MEYIIDEQGKWEDYSTYRILIEPSDDYISQMELQEQQRIKQELLEKQSNTIVEEYLLDYEFRLSMLELGI